jgi:hypothetical protein
MTTERRPQDYNNTDNLPRHKYFPMPLDVRCDVCGMTSDHENYDARKVHTN